MRHEPLPENLQSIVDVFTDVKVRQMYEWLDRQDELRKPKHPKLSLSRVVLGLSRGELNGEDRECLQETARRNKQVFDPLRPHVDIRDLYAALASAGGYLKQTEVREAIDILRPWSVTAQAGMLVESGLTGDIAFPKVTVKSMPAWLNTETAQVSPSTPTLSQAVLTPKQVGALITYSRQLSKQANADAFVGRDLLRTLGTVIDQAVINGSGASGQPLGIVNTAGVQAQSGTTLNAGTATMKRKSAEANVTDESITFLSTPAVRELLEGRERATGGGRFVWDKDQVADRRALVSTDVPTATMICSDFSLVYFGIWGQGFVLEINPYDTTGFKAGLIQARMVVSCDVAVLHPAAFIVASSIT